MVTIKRHIKDEDAQTEIYNRAYEAVYISTEENDTLRAENERLRVRAQKLVDAVMYHTNAPDDEGYEAHKALSMALFEMETALRGEGGEG